MKRLDKIIDTLYPKRKYKKTHIKSANICLTNRNLIINVVKEHRWLKRALNYVYPNRRKRGILTKTWIEEVINIMRDKAMREEEWRVSD